MQYIILMNNIHILYVVQKLKDSEILPILGDRWVRKRRGYVRSGVWLKLTWIFYVVDTSG